MINSAVHHCLLMKIQIIEIVIEGFPVQGIENVSEHIRDHGSVTDRVIDIHQDVYAFMRDKYSAAPQQSVEQAEREPLAECHICLVHIIDQLKKRGKPIY